MSKSLSGFQSIARADEIQKNEPTLRNITWKSWIERTLNRLSKWLLTTVFCIIVLWKHDAEITWAVIGAILNGWLSVALKMILNQKRPNATMKSDPGMPSSHSQSIFFAVSFAVLSMVASMGLNIVTVPVGVLALAFSSYISWLRVLQRFHTISQVTVGAVLGILCSMLWFHAWDAVVFEAYISFLWVRIVVIVGAVLCSSSFLLHVIKHWIKRG